ncbi:RDD family protein [Natranaerofaba carboxydovora]|uniref:RDD family protein n=1 Tax=Natranaerofaba carboxydovora TaxID=2742683 RepID=UPI001F13CD42|nr:RDD family protein [Natranaerofaba carboxydovora]UMZ73662.1 RDD family protein [Natranaerofaba carboxydovora]
MSNYKECPFCGEEILSKAVKCKHCYSMLENDSEMPPKPPTSPIPAKPPTLSKSSFSSHASSSSAASTTDQKSSSPPPPPPPPSNAVMSNPTPSMPPSPPPLAPNPPGFGGDVMSGSGDFAYDYPKASMGKRILGYIVDGIVAMVPLIILIPIALMPIYRYIASDGWITPSGFEWALGIIGIIIGFGWSIVYSFVRDGLKNGQSYGKRAAGLMVVRLTDNKPCNKVDSFKRNVVAAVIGAVLSWIPGLNMIASFAEPLVAAIDKKGLRLGDRFAKTQVILKEDYR